MFRTAGCPGGTSGDAGMKTYQQAHTELQDVHLIRTIYFRGGFHAGTSSRKSPETVTSKVFERSSHVIWQSVSKTCFDFLESLDI